MLTRTSQQPRIAPFILLDYRVISIWYSWVDSNHPLIHCHAADALNRRSRICSVMSNRYGIALDSWTEWAATEKVSETVAAEVLLICQTRPLQEVVAKLTPREFERVDRYCPSVAGLTRHARVRNG